MKIVSHFLVFFTTTISALICIFPKHPVSSGYENIFLLPMVFLLSYYIFLAPLLQKQKNLFTVVTVTLITWIRYVVIPFTSAYTGTYNGVGYLQVDDSSIRLSIFLMIYEIIVVSIFLNILVKIQKPIKSKKIKKNYELKGNPWIYLIFIMFAALIYITMGKQNDLLQFFIIAADTGERIGDITSTTLVAARQIILCGIIFLFLLVVDFARKKYNITKNIIFVNIALVMALVNVSIIVGERRSVQIYTAIATILVLNKTFPQHRKKITLTVSGMAGLVLILMSIYKFFTAFYFDSYTEAFAQSSFDSSEWAATFQSYFYGPQNIAVAVDMGKFLSIDPSTLLYDLFRSIFGVSFFLKDITPMTVEVFNTYIYGYPKSNGHILSSIGYGYIYFGVLLAPIIVCFNIWLSIKIENLLYRTTSLEMIYLYGYILIRISQNIYSSTPPLINLSTIMFVTMGIIYMCALSFKSTSIKKKSILLKT